MSHLYDALVLACEFDEFIRLSQRCGQGFFDQNIGALFHQCAGNFEVMNCGRRHGGRADLAMRGEHLLDGTEGPATELSRYRIRAIKVRIDHTHQANRVALLFQFFVDAGVIASENAHPHHGDGNRIVSLQEGTLGRLVANEQQIVNVKPAKSISINYIRLNGGSLPNQSPAGHATSTAFFERKYSTVTCEPLRCSPFPT